MQAVPRLADEHSKGIYMVTRMALASVAAWAVLAVAAGPAAGENWSQWRGPAFDGSSGQTHLPTTWGGADGKNIAWKTPMPGVGNSTPVVWGGKVFLTSAQEGGLDLYGLCVELPGGKELWRVKLGVGNKKILNYNVVSPSPACDEKAVYFLFGTGDMAALDHDGKILWQQNLEKAYGPVAIKWGYSASPLLYKGRLYVNLLRREKPYDYTPDAGKYKDLESLLVGLDPSNGKELFKARRDTEADDEHRESYATPIPCEIAARSEVVLIGGDYITGHDSSSGKELWRWMYNPQKLGTWRRVVSSPVACGELIVGCLPRHTGVYAVRPGQGKMPQDSAAWTFTGSTPDAVTPLYYRGRVYVLNGVKKDLTCLEATSGKVIWKTELKTKDVLRASPTGADGKIYMISQAGEVLVAQAGDEFKLISRFEMGEPPVRSTIVPVDGGRLLIRTGKNLYCVQEKK